MRLPFPERVPLKWAVLFASVLFVVEQMQGTDELFSICVFLFILMATLAFNLAGGFTRASGGYIFFYAVLGSILGWTSKAWLGEAADTNLRQPNLTAEVFLGGIASMLVAVLVSRKISRRRGVLEEMLKEKDIPTAILGCVVLGVGLTVALATVPFEDGSLLSGLGQFNNWIPLAIMLGVPYEIRRSGGRNSMTPMIFVAGAVSFALGGLVNFSKEGIFFALTCYVIAACSMRYRVSLRWMAGMAVIFGLMIYYLVPYSQYGRQFRSEEAAFSLGRFDHNLAAAMEQLSDLPGVRERYELEESTQMEISGSSYFNVDQGLLGRLQMVKPDDMLIDAAERGRNPFGLLPLLDAMAAAVPHVLWPDKPSELWGNLYAHEIGGMIDDRDMTTGISFSPSGDAYYMAGWYGVLLVAPLVWFALFVFFDTICGDTRRSPWGLVAIAVFAHMAPEGMLGGAILSIDRYGLGLVVAAVVCAYVMPAFGSIFFRSKESGNAPQEAVPAEV